MWRIRPAEEEDHDAVLALWERAGQSMTSGTEWNALITGPTSAVLVAEESEEIVGAAVATYDGWRAYIYHVATAPIHRRRGIGRTLIDAAESYLVDAGAQQVFVMVNGANTDGLALVGAAEYLPAGDIVMAKSLPARAPA